VTWQEMRTQSFGDNLQDVNGKLVNADPFNEILLGMNPSAYFLPSGGTPNICYPTWWTQTKSATTAAGWIAAVSNVWGVQCLWNFQNGDTQGIFNSFGDAGFVAVLHWAACCHAHQISIDWGQSIQMNQFSPLNIPVYMAGSWCNAPECNDIRPLFLIKPTLNATHPATVIAEFKSGLLDSTKRVYSLYPFFYTMSALNCISFFLALATAWRARKSPGWSWPIILFEGLLASPLRAWWEASQQPVYFRPYRPFTYQIVFDVYGPDVVLSLWGTLCVAGLFASVLFKSLQKLFIVAVVCGCIVLMSLVAYYSEIVATVMFEVGIIDGLLDGATFQGVIRTGTEAVAQTNDTLMGATIAAVGVFGLLSVVFFFKLFLTMKSSSNASTLNTVKRMFKYVIMQVFFFSVIHCIKDNADHDVPAP